MRPPGGAAGGGAWRIGALDETGQEKQGQATAGVKRQYMGCAGRVANGINTVHLSYVREKTGHALIGARQWIPAEHIDDPVTSLVMGLPLDLEFRTKGQLAIDICAEAFADGIGLTSSAGTRSTAAAPSCGSSSKTAARPTCCGFPRTFTLTLARGVTLTCAEAASRLLKARRRWEVRSAGKGSKGERWYAWAWLATASPAPPPADPPPPARPASWPFTTATCPKASRSA